MAVDGTDLKMVTADNTLAKYTPIGSGTPEKYLTQQTGPL
jgi:hypothetical protein